MPELVPVRIEFKLAIILPKLQRILITFFGAHTHTFCPHLNFVTRWLRNNEQFGVLTEVCLQCQSMISWDFLFLGGGLSLILSSLSLVLAKSVACIDSQSRILDWRRIFLLVIHVSKLFANGRHRWHGIGWPSVLRLLCQVGLLSHFLCGCINEIDMFW